MKRSRSSSSSPRPVSKAPTVQHISRARLWLFRLVAALGAPLLLCLVLELVLRIAGFGYPTGVFLRSEVKGQPVLEQNDKFAWRFFGPELARQPFPFVLPAHKEPGTIRIFVLGESAAFGDPQPEFGLPRLLQVLLKARYPKTKFEVVNVAMTAINSHAILPIARDCAAQNGDIWVVYMGNNEVVGPFGAGTVFGARGTSRAVVRLSLALKTTRLGQAFERIIGAFSHHSPLEHEWGGMEMFVKNQVPATDLRLPIVYQNFESNLRDIIGVGERNGVSIVLGTVGTNLKDCAPFASTHRTNLGAETLGQWEANYRLGEDAQAAGKFTEALAAFGKAATIDDSFADLQFRMGQCHTALGQREEALNHFTLARDLDALRFRCDSSLNKIIRTVATQNSARKFSFFDCDQVLREQSRDGLPGQEFFYEHVHLTFKGNYLLAKGFAEKVAKALPEEVTKAGGADWASLDDCAQTLGWTDWSRQQGLSLIASRLNDPPFTAQLNHADQLKRLGQEMEQLAAAKASGGLKQSLESCREAAAADPQDWVIQSVLARVQTAQGDFSGAADSLRKVRELMPHYVEGLQELGGLLANEHQDQDAELAFKDALKLEPSSVVAHTGLGQLYERQEKFELAIIQFNAALRTKPYWSPAHLGLGKCLEKIGKTEEAQPHLRAALKNRVNTAASFRALAKFCFEKGWYNEAVTNFSDVLRFEPGDANTRVNLGLALEKLGRHEEATAQYRDAVRLSPNLAEAHARLAWELGRNGDDSQALQHFAEAVRLKPDLIEARLNLGIALLKQGRRDEADLQFREVLRRNPGNAVAVRYLQSLGSMPK